MKKNILLLLMTIYSFIGHSATNEQKIKSLESKLQYLESKLSQQSHSVSNWNNRSKNSGVALFLFGAFCALWAQNTNRNPWVWFFLGLFFSVVTVLVLLSKNADDQEVYPQ